MGITALWPLLELIATVVSATAPTRGLADEVVGLDMSVLMHAALAAPDAALELVPRQPRAGGSIGTSAQCRRLAYSALQRCRVRV